ncbi:hypothetical protein HYPSUDRAFT_62325 [Hypholoma sublateritium FD-334 SS-4]|uniref:Smr domain-containing protein n=1 Tax=Hypholoma sublateritium (strain FD-334 SS-4) TaxID=945553 RepID=A0A0D2MV94_HYPSF|nr:hypothetical protein HYPSUDRAFT_62325 [Hypholoma sublateritium FD-334 SS-4]
MIHPTTRESLFDSLESQYCPTIDSSLIAALLAEIESDAGGNQIAPTQSQIDNLHATLNALSLQAEESQLSELSDMHLTSQFDETISSWTTPENTLDQASGSSGSSSSSTHPFSSPLGFLQAALPEIPTARLNKALRDSEKDGAEMWDIVAGILTEESIREMEERGLEGLEEDERLSELIYDDDEWETVSGKKKPSDVAKRKSRPRKFALADIRQQHQHVQSHHKKYTHENVQRPQPAVADPWTQISSLSEHISSLLPPHPPSVFQSFFHSPKYTTSYDALRAALTSLCQNCEEDGDEHTVIFNILDFVMPQYEVSDDVHRARIVSDVQLAVAVTKGGSDEALQLIDLLRELDSNAELGVYHQPAPETWKKEAESPPISKVRLPSSPPPIQPPPVHAKGISAPTTRNKPSPYQWQAVPQRKAVPRGPHPLAHHIPAYVRDVNGMKTARAYGAKGVKAAADASEFQRRMDETMRKRNEALREASRMWQKGNAKTRGGEVAFYFAERAREFQEVARQEGLNAARAMVHSKRVTSGNSDTVDLHGTTVAEAITIVKEILNDEASSISQAKPMKIITGRGTHSVNQVGVLKPAVKKALVEAGWIVGSWDGGLVVRQRRK